MASSTAVVAADEVLEVLGAVVAAGLVLGVLGVLEAGTVEMAAMRVESMLVVLMARAVEVEAGAAAMWAVMSVEAVVAVAVGLVVRRALEVTVAAWVLGEKA